MSARSTVLNFQSNVSSDLWSRKPAALTRRSIESVSSSLQLALQTRWKLLGYDVSSLKSDMKKLFNELEADARNRASKSRDGFVSDVLKPLFENGSSK
jgi:hypothetical protein